MNDPQANRQSSPPDTYFASAARATAEEIRALSERALNDPILGVVFEAVGGYAMVVDCHRQIIAANEALLDILEAKVADNVLGLRPGEALKCVNAERGPNGCGTSKQCRHCGAVTALLAAQVSNEPIDGSCSLTCASGGNVKPRDFRVRVSLVTIGGDRVYVFVFHDVTAVARRELLERIFLHDLSNLATGLLGWSEELALSSASEAASQVFEMARRMGEQLDEQRLLVNFESGALKASMEHIDFAHLESSLRVWFGRSDCARGKSLQIDGTSGKSLLATDRSLLLRVLGNLIKNAFEATEPGGTVTLRVKTSKESTAFEVHNSAVMPKDIAAQVFKRRFSTKGPGHGLGLHAVQLLGEACLGGQASFDTVEATGTTFRFLLPNGEQTAS